MAEDTSQPVDTIRTCGHCGTELVPHARYCHQCGRAQFADRQRVWPVRIVRAVLVIAMADCIVGAILAVWEIETIVATGPILAGLGIALIVLSRQWSLRRAMLVGLAHAGIAVAIFLWIAIAEMGPGRAHVPVSVVICFYGALLLRPTWQTIREVRVCADPSRCQKCGYLLFGLSEPRCPECGTGFDPATVPAGPQASPRVAVDGDSQLR